jgi:type II secretory pathway pseudopilin PulG
MVNIRFFNYLIVLVAILTFVGGLCAVNSTSQIDTADHRFVVEDNFVIFLCLSYYNSNLKWPADNNQLQQYFDKPRGGFNTSLLSNATLSINGKNNLEIKMKNGSTYRKIELRNVNDGKIKYKAKYFESNDEEFKKYLPFEMSFTGMEYTEFYGEITAATKNK